MVRQGGNYRAGRLAAGSRPGHKYPGWGFSFRQAPDHCLLHPLPSNRTQNPKRLEHWGTPGQSLPWNKSCRSGMKPLLSERDSRWGVGVGAGLTPATGEERDSRHPPRNPPLLSLTPAGNARWKPSCTPAGPGCAPWRLSCWKSYRRN